MPISSKQKNHIASVLSGQRRQKNICPVKDIMASYGDKWSMYTVLLLGQNQRMKFNELRHGINGISQRMLTVTLRSLEQDGIIQRSVYQQTPLRMEYRLTQLGEGLFKQLLGLATWADEHFAEIMKSRKEFELKRVYK